MFVGRKADKSIYGVWTSRPTEDNPGIEELPDNAPEVVAFLAPKAPIDLSNIDNLDKTLKALGLCVAQVGSLSVAQMKALFANKWNSL